MLLVDSFGIVDVEEGWTGIERHVTKSRDRSRSLSFSPSGSFYRSGLTVIQGSRNSWAAGVSCRINRDKNFRFRVVLREGKTRAHGQYQTEFPENENDIEGRTKELLPED